MDELEERRSAAEQQARTPSKWRKIHSTVDKAAAAIRRLEGSRS